MYPTRNIKTEISIRPARQADAHDLARLFDMADDGLCHPVWAKAAREGQSAWDVGAAGIVAGTGRHSLGNTVVATHRRRVAGACLSYEMTPSLASDREASAFSVLKERILGDWYIDSLAVMPEARRLGLGHRLLEAAAQRAEGRDLALIVFARNIAVKEFYSARAFSEAAKIEGNPTRPGLVSALELLRRPARSPG